MRRNLIFLFVPALLVMSLFLMQSGRAQGKMSMTDCQSECSQCQSECEKAKAYCQRLGGKAASAERIGLFTDCIKMCETSKGFLKRNSQFHPKVCLGERVDRGQLLGDPRGLPQSEQHHAEAQLHVCGGRSHGGQRHRRVIDRRGHVQVVADPDGVKA